MPLRNQRRGFFSRLRRLNHASELTMHIYKISKMADKYAGDPVISHLSTAVVHLDFSTGVLVLLGIVFVLVVLGVVLKAIMESRGLW